MDNFTYATAINYYGYLPKEWTPINNGWHTKKEYEEIMEIPNVVLIHPSYSSDELVKHSKLVATVRGTASYDAAKNNIPSLVFGDIPFSILPSVYKIESITEYLQ